MNKIADFSLITDLADRYFDAFWVAIWDDRKRFSGLGGVDLLDFSEGNDEFRKKADKAILNGFVANIGRRKREL